MTHLQHKEQSDQERLGQRIRLARENARLSLAELGKKVGVSGQAVLQWEQGATKPPLHRLEKIAAELNVDVVWLTQGVSAEEYADAMAMRVMGGAVEMRDSKLQPTSLVFHTNFFRQETGFAWVIDDEANTPVFLRRDVVFVSLDRKAKPGNYVLAKTSNGEIVIGRYRRRGQPPEHEIVFANEDWGSVLIDPSEIIGVVTELSRNLMRSGL